MLQFQVTAQSSVRRIILLATALGFSVIGMIWAAVETDIRQEQAFARRTATQTAQNYARLFDEHIRQAINETDNTVKFIRQDYLRADGRFDLQAWFRNQYSFKELALQFTIIGADGRMETTTTAGAAPRVDLSDREHFRVHLAAGADNLFISKPVLGRASGRWSIQLTRRITDEAGRFRGVIVASLDPFYLSRFYDSIDLGKGGGITVIGRDGVVRAMAGLSRQTLGSRYAHEVMLTHALRDGLFVDGGAAHEVGRATTYRAIHDWPLVVAVRVDDGEARARRTAAAAHQRLVAAGLSVGVLALILLGIAYWRRFGAALASLESSRATARAVSRELALTLDNMSQGIMMVDAAGHVAVVNRNALELLSLPDRFTRAGFPLSDLLAHERAAGDAIVADPGGGAPATADAPSVREHSRADGTVLEIATRQLPGGGFVQTYTDVTQRRRSEQALRDARDVAEKASQARTAFLATMSHEIRTPLNGIIGMSSILDASDLSVEQRSHLKTIHECGEALLDIVNDVLDYAKLDSGAIALEQTAIDVRALATSVKEMLRPRALEKALDFDLFVADDVPARVEADGTRIRQVLINLVANALKFTLSGGVAVSVALHKQADGRAALRFSVIDSGIGIADDARARLFKEFSQVDASITRRFGGTGLGLAICKRIVDALGGEIGVDSTLGKGSVFWFDVPTREVATSDAPVHAVRTQLPARLAVLLVEDNPVNQQVATLLLTAMGHAVTIAEHGRVALELASDRPFDVILMDMQMPVLDGTQTARALRRGGGPNAETVIIGLTANAFAADRQACLDAGMDEFLAKPVTRAKLEAVLGNLARRPAKGAPPPVSGGEIDHGFRQLLFDEIGPAASVVLLRTFVDEGRRLLAALSEAARTGDTAMMAALLHQLKGAAGNLGHGGITVLAGIAPQDLGSPAAFDDFSGRLEAFLAAEERDLQAAA